MKRFSCLLCTAFLFSTAVPGQVFISEIMNNPPTSGFDDTKEFIELTGTPGMKLDGFAIALINGGQQKFFPLGSIPPEPHPDPDQEIDEFFSLDGLSLGRNGILVIGIGAAGQYGTLTGMSDTNFQRWTTLWNGGLDAAGKLGNDGSSTYVLLRNRPGNTQANPVTPAGLLWGKDVTTDRELITPVNDPQDGINKDQFGDGEVDNGENLDAFGAPTRDHKGKSTPAVLGDDLEICDEVSWEHDRGWEYDFDGRHVDLGSPSNGLPQRRVHALDDPQGINPDALVRVDYRTKGLGWTPVSGATGPLANGNNWQDTATEQWIRGELVQSGSGQGTAPFFYFDNAPNPNPDSIQPYFTNVPLWLNDGVATDYNFTTSFTYQIMAGRTNPLAIPFIPGDVDRDGDADSLDIAKTAAVFGNDDWIFSNSFSTSPEGDSNDPASQTRPWDVNGTGDNGIECCDLQWTLNFQGNSDGRIVGRRYDTTTPSATGVHLNPNTGTVCTLTTSVHIPGANTLTTLAVGDTVEITLRGQLTSGANNTAGQQNGIMQFVNDVDFSSGGVIRVVSVSALGAFSKTRAAIESPQGTSGDLGIHRVNGHTTSFTQGIGAPANLYRVTLQAIGLGSTTITFANSATPKFALSTPGGLTLGHTDNCGLPQAVAYPALLVEVISAGCEPCDADCNGTVNPFDIQPFLALLAGAETPCAPCTGDTDENGTINPFDIQPFVDCLSQ